LSCHKFKLTTLNACFSIGLARGGAGQADSASSTADPIKIQRQGRNFMEMSISFAVAVAVYRDAGWDLA